MQSRRSGFRKLAGRKDEFNDSEKSVAFAFTMTSASSLSRCSCERNTFQEHASSEIEDLDHGYLFG